MVTNVVLGSALKSTLLSINRTQNAIDDITQRLATGLKVNSAIDQPQNFFTAQSLSNTASDYARLLDGIGQSVRTIQEGIIGAQTIDQLLNQAEGIVTESIDFLDAGELDPGVFEREVDISPPTLDAQILAGTPDVYYRLDETGGPVIDSGFGAAGPVNANRQGGASPGAAALYNNGSQPSVNFDGANDRIAVSDSTLINTSITTARTVELVFNADDVIGRQVLYEEGAGVNGFTIYLDGNTLFVTGEDDQGAQRWNDANINSSQIALADGGPVAIVPGQTYHVAFVYDAATDSFSGYLDGVLMNSVGTAGAPNFPSHSGNIGIGAAVDGVQFHDGEAGAGFRFNGRISNVAIYNRALSDSVLASHANSLNASTSIQHRHRDFENVLDQITRVAIDSHYRGINLLEGDDLTTFFNDTLSSSLVTKGQTFTSEAFAIQRFDFNDRSELELMLERIRSAITEVRQFGSTLATNLSVIETRLDYTREYINTHKAGSDDLTLADLNREGARQLAAQVRLDTGVTALALAGLSQANVLRLFGTG